MEEPVLNLYHLGNQGFEEEDEEESSQTFSSAVSPSPSSSETYMVGFVLVKIVGIQYYTGIISGREMVGFVREPLNPYDPNAIKVLNIRTIQVGHVERSAAAVLSPLIDSGLITIEGIVPKASKTMNKFKIPCQIHIFATVEAFPRVRSAISRGGLSLICNSDCSITLSESVIVKEKLSRKETQSVDEIFKLVGSSLDNKGEKKLVEPPQDVINSELFMHQKEGLGWLIHRESSSDMPPFWEEKDGLYVNVLTNFRTNQPPEPLRGGIFADDMGMGKTLTLLSLIAANRPSSTLSQSRSINVPENIEEDEAASLSAATGKTPKKRGRGKKVVETCKKRKVTSVEDGDTSNLEPRTTLVVCPPSVLSTWIMQLEEHTKPGSLKVYLYYGNRNKDAEELQKNDVVLTTYNTLASDAECGSPISKIEWFRIILDEAHLIKNETSKQSKAALALKGKRRWAVTGTPIQNSSFDLFSLMAFLKFEPFSVKSYWRSLVQRPLVQGNANALPRLQVLMAAISLRRLKDNSLVGLPSKSIETSYVELSAEEREKYDQLEADAKNVVRNYISAGSVLRNYSTVLSIILRLRQFCDDMALCPSDLISLLSSSTIEDVSSKPELLQKLVLMLQDGDDFDCPICISPPTNTVITRCAHIFCKACIEKALNQQKACCPLCRRSLSASDLFRAPPATTESQDTGILSSTGSTSSKVSTLLKLLLATRNENPSTKSVVFSQFRKMLILLEAPLKEAGFAFLRLDGSTSANKRAQVIKEFKESVSGGPTVLLASLKAAGTGINLTAASRVYLLDPWWNPAVEEQAMDRVHRIGQKENVKIVRLITRNSIEERVLVLQEKKKTLAREAFSRKGGKDQRQIGVGDLHRLMAL